MIINDFFYHNIYNIDFKDIYQGLLPTKEDSYFCGTYLLQELQLK